LVSAITIALLESRVAAITMAGAVAFTAGGRSLRRALLTAGAIAVVVMLVDAARGFPLAQKFSGGLNPRVALWLTALAMFRDAPWVGQGLHTFGLLQGEYASTLALPGWIP